MLCERGRTVYRSVPHVDVGHPHYAFHAALVSFHVAIHEVGIQPIADPIVARWGGGVAVNDCFARVSWIVFGVSWALCWDIVRGWRHFSC